MNIFTKIAEAEKAKKKKLEGIEGWPDVYIKKMSGKVIFAMQGQKKDDLNTLTSYVKTISDHVIDEDDNLVFSTKEEVEFLKNLDFKVLSEIFKQVMNIGSSKDIEEVKKI